MARKRTLHRNSALALTLALVAGACATNGTDPELTTLDAIRQENQATEPEFETAQSSATDDESGAAVDSDIEDDGVTAVSGTLCSGEDLGEGLDIPFQWAEGEERQISFVSTQAGQGVSPAVVGATATTPVTVSALEVDAEGATLRWSNGETTFDDAALNATLQEFAVPLFTIDAQMRTDGEITGIANAQAVIDQLIEFASDAAGGDEELLAQVDNLYNSFTDEQIVSTLGGDLMIYQPGSISVTEGEVSRSPVSIASPLALAPVEGTVVIEHLGIDEQNCEALRITNVIGSDALVANVQAVIDGFAEGGDAEASAAGLLEDASLVRTTIFRFDHGLGRVRQVDFTEVIGITTGAGVQSQVETKVLTDVTDQ